jgi:tetratricopeptide (TPR) repeat protein
LRYFILLICVFVFSSVVRSQDLTSADQYSQRAIANFQKNDLDGAIADFTKAIELNAQQLEFCYYFRALAYYRKGNIDQAILDLNKAIGLKADVRFYSDRGNLLAKKGDLDRALADLDKAVELSPQNAKAYGDRGIIRLMRGEVSQAEADFKKCFELDPSLKSQFASAAEKIKQRGVAGDQEKPADVEVLKFNWTESPAKVLVAPASQTITVTTTPVSASGTRVLADPNVKGQPGPPEVADASGTSGPTSRESASTTKSVMEYKFTAAIKNTGAKTIVGVKWAYYFEPKDLDHERLAYLFTAKTSIKPGKEKTLTDSIFSAGPQGSVKLPHKNNLASYNERVAILSLEYDDSTTWQTSHP